jgi:SM-20-related protein
MKSFKKIGYFKDIFVYDDIFTDRENLDIYELVSRSNFYRSNVDVHILPNKDIDVKWRSDISPSSQLINFTLEKYKSTIDIFDWTTVNIKSHYINFSIPTTVDMIHPDSRGLEKNSFTILHYVNYYWDKNWHGQTNFYSENLEEICFSSMIKPGRIVIFDGTIPHSATAPSNISLHPRYTLATKIMVNGS